MKTSYYFLLLIIALNQSACKKSDDQVKPSQPVTEINQKTYNIISIKYAVIPGSIVEEFTEQRPSLEYSNRSDSRQRVVVDPQGIFERSLFKKDSRLEYSIVNNEQLFSVPLEIQNDRISLGDKIWRYSEQETKLPTKLNFKDSVYVESNKKLIATLSITYKKITSSYTAQLQEQSSGKLIDITGVWTGIYPIKKNSTYTTRPL